MEENIPETSVTTDEPHQSCVSLDTTVASSNIHLPYISPQLYVARSILDFQQSGNNDNEFREQVFL